MAKLSSYKLCPGTFFSILCTAKKVASNSDVNINEVNMMLDLVKLGDPSASVRNVSRPETDVAKVKSCSRDSASWMGFNKSNYILKYKTVPALKTVFKFNVENLGITPCVTKLHY